MIAKKITFASVSATQPLRNFSGRVPSIKFIGKRAAANCNIGAFSTESATAQPLSKIEEIQPPPQVEKKCISPNAELEFADAPADRWARLEFSELEMEIINQGGNDCDDVDWHKIQL